LELRASILLNVHSWHFFWAHKTPRSGQADHSILKSPGDDSPSLKKPSMAGVFLLLKRWALKQTEDSDLQCIAICQSMMAVQKSGIHPIAMGSAVS